MCVRVCVCVRVRVRACGTRKGVSPCDGDGWGPCDGYLAATRRRRVASPCLLVTPSSPHPASRPSPCLIPARRLHAAVEAGRTAEVLELLAEGAFIEALDAVGGGARGAGGAWWMWGLGCGVGGANRCVRPAPCFASLSLSILVRYLSLSFLLPHPPPLSSPRSRPRPPERQHAAADGGVCGPCGGGARAAGGGGGGAGVPVRGRCGGEGAGEREGGRGRQGDWQDSRLSMCGWLRVPQQDTEQDTQPWAD